MLIDCLNCANFCTQTAYIESSNIYFNCYSHHEMSSIYINFYIHAFTTQFRRNISCFIFFVNHIIFLCLFVNHLNRLLPSFRYFTDNFLMEIYNPKWMKLFHVHVDYLQMIVGFFFSLCFFSLCLFNIWVLSWMPVDSIFLHPKTVWIHSTNVSSLKWFDLNFATHFMNEVCSTSHVSCAKCTLQILELNQNQTIHTTSSNAITEYIDRNWCLINYALFHIQFVCNIVRCACLHIYYQMGNIYYISIIYLMQTYTYLNTTPWMLLEIVRLEYGCFHLFLVELNSMNFKSLKIWGFFSHF